VRTVPITPNVLLEKSEREAFCDLVTELGPDAPTLCAGWTTSDLAVHLIICEARPQAWLAVPMGDRVPALDRYFAGVVDKERARGWNGLVDRVRRGPAYGPTKYAAVRERMLFREFLIHHEDVRRANGATEPRTGIPLVQERAWEKVPAFAKRMLVVDDGHGLELVHTDGRVKTVKVGPDAVRVVGEPVELLLYVFGRTSVAQVEVVDNASALRVRDTSVLAALPRVRTA
jgi:uncharacterized protein (TIGR03085 family)